MPLILSVDADTKKAISKIKGASKQAAADVKKLEQKSVQSASKIKSAFTALGPVLGALGFAIVLRGLKNLVTETITFRDEIAKFSKATGIGVEFLSAMGFAAERSGASIESMNKGFGRLARNISDAENGLATPLRAFEALGINITKADGSLRNLQEIFPDIAEGFKNMTDSTKKAALAQELFGRAGLELVPLLNLGAEGVAELTREAERLGIVFGEQAAGEAEAAADALLNFNTAAKALGQNLASSTLPALTSMANNLANIVATLSAFGEFRQEFLTGFGGLIEPIEKIIPTLGGFATAMLNAAQAQAKFFKAIPPIAPPVPRVEVPLEGVSDIAPAMAEVITGLGEAETITERWLKLQESIALEIPKLPANIRIVNIEQERALALTENLANAFGQAVAFSDDLLLSVKNIAKQLAVKAFTAFITSLFPGSGGFAKQFFGFAHGTSSAPGGLALVGERGPEIVNLPRGSQVIPNNQISNSFSTNNSFTLVFPAVRELDDFELQTNVIPKINALVQRGESRLSASEIV